VAKHNEPIEYRTDINKY